MATIYYAGFFSAKYGYTEAANGYRSIIEPKYPEVQFIDLEQSKDLYALGNDDLTQSSVILHKRPVRDLPEPLFESLNTAKRLIYTTVWECTAIPSTWVKQLKDAHEIMAPSDFAMRPFKLAIDAVKQGTEYTVIPHVLRKYCEDVSRFPNIPKDRVNILVISSQLTDRKGLDLAIRAFYSLPVEVRCRCRLIIKGTTNTPQYLTSITPRCNKPDIYCVNDYLSDSDLDNLIISCDILLSPNRGEGYGIDIARCLYSDMKVVATDVGGYIDVVKPNQENFFPIKSEMDCVASLSTFHDIDTHGMMWPCCTVKSTRDALLRAIKLIGDKGRPLHSIVQSNDNIDQHNTGVANLIDNFIGRIK